MASSSSRRITGLLSSALLVPLLVTGLLLSSPAPSDAASGGRIGGGSFRSAPSTRSYRGGSGSYGGGYPGGYRGGYGGGYYGGYGGGGFGFPFIVPIFGFGGGLLGLLVLMAVVGVLLNAVRGVAGNLGGSDGEALPGSLDGPVAIAQVQVGLLASARELQSDLRRLAATADTGSSAGLQKVLQETSLALLRNPELWVYANSEVGQVPFASAEATFNRLSVQERSKLERELTTNVAGVRSGGISSLQAGRSDAASDYIAVTLLIASRRPLKIRGADTAEALRESLQQIGGVGADDLLALEVIWQPEGIGEVLSSDQLLTAYPQLQHL
ncbi:MAG: DUF1517 domain-containing protein [Cyanobium sp.]